MATCAGVATALTNALLLVRCAVLNGRNVRIFKRWYPPEAPLAAVELAACCPQSWPLP